MPAFLRSLPARRRALIVVLLGIGVALMATALVLTLSVERRGGALAVGGPFTLVDGTGRRVTDEDFRGSPFLVFFGFTHCPDVCPTKLFEISEVFRAMGDRGRSVKALFVTVDPERDDPAAMKSYVSSFDGRIVGLTGTRPEIDAIVKNYRAYARRVPLKDGDYTMEHTALVYMMDGRGEFVGSLNLDRPPAEAAAELLRRS